MRDNCFGFRGDTGTPHPDGGGVDRPSWGRWTPLLALLLAIVGCECSGAVDGGGHGGGAPCTSTAECAAGEMCIDGRCTRPGGGEGCEADVDGDGYGVGCEWGPDCDEGDPTQTGTEVCDGYDNDCDGVADNGVLSECGDCDLTCRADGVGSGGGSDPAWDVEGDDSEGVGVDDDGALVLDSRSVDTHFIWIANTGQGTVSKVDTRTYVEVARYVTGPDGAGNDPSRTSVNSAGDVYVGNRTGRSVTKISALGAACPDTNGDGTVTTSTGPDDVLAWGTDDCVLWNTRLTDGGIIRAVAAQDVEGPDFTLDHYVWIGGWDAVVWKLDGDDGSIVLRTASPSYNYGFALDGNGNLWISGRSSTVLGRIDTTRCVDDASCSDPVCGADGDTCVKQAIPYPSGINPYGITVDFNQRVWTANHGSNSVTRYDPSAPVGARWTVTNIGNNCHGIAADGEGWVWAACYGAGIHRLSADDPSINGLVAGTGGFSCKGMAVDFDGKIWSINLGHNSAIVVEPGPGLTDATVTTGVANRIVSPYTYSDMTGQQLRLATNPRGYYRRVFEGCDPAEPTTGTVWGELRWDADVPPGTRLLWRVRTAPTREELVDAEWVVVAEVPPAAPPADVDAALGGAGVTPARFLEVEVQLHSMRESTMEVITPRVRSMELTHTCPPSVE